jgi:hypothetical protein
MALPVARRGNTLMMWLMCGLTVWWRQLVCQPFAASRAPTATSRRCAPPSVPCTPRQNPPPEVPLQGVQPFGGASRLSSLLLRQLRQLMMMMAPSPGSSGRSSVVWTTAPTIDAWRTPPRPPATLLFTALCGRRWLSENSSMSLYCISAVMAVRGSIGLWGSRRS